MQIDKDKLNALIEYVENTFKEDCSVCPCRKECNDIYGKGSPLNCFSFLADWLTE